MATSPVRNIVSFGDRATAGQAKPHDELLVIRLTIQDIDVARILVDTGCLTNVIYKNALERMGIDLSAITDDPNPIIGLSGNITMTLGSVDLSVRAGSVTKMVEFLVVDGPTAYNAIVGTPWLNSLRAIPSTFHLCLKFPTLLRVETIQGDRKAPQVCLAAGLKRKNSESETNPKKQATHEPASQDPPEIFWQSQRAEVLEGKREPTCEPVISVCLDETNPERCVEIGANLRNLLKAELTACLKKNLKWQVCVDFTDLNKACPKDCFPLPHIDRLVETTAGNKLLSSMDTTPLVWDYLRKTSVKFIKRLGNGDGFLPAV